MLELEIKRRGMIFRAELGDSHKEMGMGKKELAQATLQPLVRASGWIVEPFTLSYLKGQDLHRSRNLPQSSLRESWPEKTREVVYIIKMKFNG